MPTVLTFKGWRIVIYTNDNKGSFDLEMTSERLARIRKAGPDADVSHCDNCGAILVP